MREMRTRRRFVWTWVAILLVGAVAGMSEAAEGVVMATGEAVVGPGGPVEARQRAIDAACVAAAAQVADELLAGRQEAKGLKKVEALVQSRPDAFIRHYKVVTETRDGDRYRVQIECTVAVEALKAMLGPAQPAAEETGDRRVLLMMAERNFPQDPFQFWWGTDYLFARPASEAGISRVLKENGFSLIDTDSARNARSAHRLAEAGPEPSLDAILQAAAALRADFVVAGKAAAEAGSPVIKGRPSAFRAWVHVRLVDRRSGRVMAEIQEEALAVATDAVAGTQNALEAAGSRAGRRLLAHLNAPASGKPAAADGPGETVTLVVQGVKPLVRFARFRTALAGLPGVEAVQTVEVSAADATLQVSVRGGARELAVALRRERFDGFQVQILDSAEGHIAVELAGGHLP